MNYIDHYLNKITMYKLTVFGLGTLATISIIFGFTGTLSLDGSRLLVSLGVLMASSFIAQQIFSTLFRVVPNQESTAITALILYFMFLPPSDTYRAAVLALVGFVAVGSKYIIAYRKKHIFNPAAIAAALVGLCGIGSAGWWIGSSVMAPFVLVFAVLLLRKLRRTAMALTFLAVALTIVCVRDFTVADQFGALLTDTLISSPLLFLAAVMLTEPLTAPSTHRKRFLYAGVVGGLYAIPLSFTSGSFTPEVALVLGNLFAYIIDPSLRQRYALRLKEKNKLAPHIYEYVWEPNRPLIFTAGQYIDLALPKYWTDWRGNRRTFSIASSPTEPEVRITMKHGQPSSKYKAVLASAEPRTLFYGQGVAGDFVLPNDDSQKLLWIAGGIGITPFRSMAKHIIDTEQHRDITLVYFAHSEEVVYREIFEEASAYGLTTIYMTDRSVDIQAVLKECAPDYQERICYIAGSDRMVRVHKNELRKQKVPAKNIKVDHFTGY